MDLRRLRIGEWVTALAGAALVVAVFLPWYETSAGDGMSGLEVLSVTDIVVLIAGVGAVALWALTATQRTVAMPLALNALLVPVIFVAAVLTLFRLVDMPFDGAERALGVWLGAVSALAAVPASLVALRDERRGEDTDLTGRPAAPPRIEAVPPPQPTEPAT